MTKRVLIRPDLMQVEDDHGTVIALLPAHEEPSLFDAEITSDLQECSKMGES